MENITKDLENMLENEEILSKCNISPYNFTRFSNLNNLNKINILFKNLNIKNNFDYIKNHDKIEKLGLYILPKSASPGFKNFRKNINYLKKKYKIYLFLENDKESMDLSDLEFLENVYEVNFVNNLSDEKLKNLIYEKTTYIIIICLLIVFSKKLFLIFYVLSLIVKLISSNNLQSYTQYCSL